MQHQIHKSKTLENINSKRVCFHFSQKQKKIKHTLRYTKLGKFWRTTDAWGHDMTCNHISRLFSIIELACFASTTYNIYWIHAYIAKMFLNPCTIINVCRFMKRLYDFAFVLMSFVFHTIRLKCNFFEIKKKKKSKSITFLFKFKFSNDGCYTKSKPL